MKKVLKLVLALFLCNSIFAQELVNPQIPESDFSKWHDETVQGFLTMGKLYCDNMPGTSVDSVWDCGNPAVSCAGSKNWPTQAVMLPDGTVAARLTTRSIIGVIASGNLFTGKLVRNMSLSQLLGFTSKDGKELITWGIPFDGRPKGFKIKFGYNGRGDSCSLSAVLENRDENRKMPRHYVGTAAYIGKTDEKNETSCVTRISNPDINGLRTLEVDFLYGKIPSGYTKLPKDAECGSVDEEVTHVTVCFSSSAYGDYFKGKKNATLVIKDFEFVY